LGRDSAAHMPQVAIDSRPELIPSLDKVAAPQEA
jgi:hypothetical protein